MEYATQGIRVAAVCPGFIDSPMWSEHLSPAYAPAFGVEPAKLIEIIAKIHMPLGRPQTAKKSEKGFCTSARRTVPPDRPWL